MKSVHVNIYFASHRHIGVSSFCGMGASGRKQPVSNEILNVAYVPFSAKTLTAFFLITNEQKTDDMFISSFYTENFFTDLRVSCEERKLAYIIVIGKRKKHSAFGRVL